jgi:FdhE protein
MPRILDPAQIEAFAERDIPRVRLPDRNRIFSARSQRLRQLSDKNAIGDYLRLMASVAESQQAALTNMHATLPTPEQLARSAAHGMPLAPARFWTRDSQWLDALRQICEPIASTAAFPTSVRDVCLNLLAWAPEKIEEGVSHVLAAERVDVASAPFLMAALQVYWVDLASRLDARSVRPLDVSGVCPVCGTLPVASVVRSEPRAQGYRYLHCALCATEWHMVRITCTQCQATADIAYHSIEGGSEAVRAESCGTCGTYRKILYQEKDAGVEPVADDLASLTLDLLMSEAGYHRGSGNPLLWQNP